MNDYMIFHHLMSGRAARSLCMGRSMEPIYMDQEVIFIYPFTDERPDPVVGDVVHFMAGYHGFNRHRVADIFVDRNNTTWYRLVTGDGQHDQFVTRLQIIGYVIPKRMLDDGVEPKDV